MRRIRSLTGMPVVMHGKKIGRLVQAELTEDLTALSAVWIDAGLRGIRRIPAENLEMIGKKAVTADSDGTRGKCKSAFALHRALSTDGRRLGAITGAQIDELSFAVTALELSGGLWDDLFLGRRCVSSYRIDSRSGDVLLQDAADEPSKEDDL